MYSATTYIQPWADTKILKNNIGIISNDGLGIY